MPPLPPLHQAQINRCLPQWASALHPDHAQRIVQRARKDYLDQDNAPYSWYANASDAARLQLQTAIEQRDNSHAQLRKALTGLQGINEFCKPLLTSKLALHVAVDKAQYISQPFETIAPIWSGTPDPEFPVGAQPEIEETTTRPVGHAQQRSLLEAALHNFEGGDEIGPYDALTLSAQDDTEVPGLTTLAFVNHCRSLDLGEQYQNHLQTIYEGAQKENIQRLSMQASRLALKVDTLIAALQGLLTGHGLKALEALCNEASQPQYDNHALRYWRFSLFGIPVQNVLLLGPDQANQRNPCILYIPGDSEHPVREFTSLQAIGQHLRQRLVQSSFRQAIINLAYKDSQVALTQKLEAALFTFNAEGERQPRDTADIHLSSTALTTPLWSTLYTDHVRCLKADARTIAVPTSDVDAKVRAERLEYWRNLGLDVLNVAAFFVPGINSVMLGVFAYELLDSVFTGFEAWEEGDTGEALEQLASLTLNAAVIAGFVAGERLIKASGFVDAMKSVWKEDRQVLWHPDMRPYASRQLIPRHVEPNSLGLYLVEGRSYLPVDDTLYEVFHEEQGQWRVRHPNDPEAYSPAVAHLGDKRWQFAHEEPLEWTDTQLLRRLGQYSEGLDEAQQLAVMRCTGTDADVLRHAQVAAQRPPALLIDALQRLQLDNEAKDIIQRVRGQLPLAAYKNYALPELLNLPEWPRDHVLKVFDGPEPWGDAVFFGEHDALGQVLIEVTRTDLENGKLSQAVLAQIDEQTVVSMLGDMPYEQRPSALDNKLADHLSLRRDALFDSLQRSHRVALSVEQQTLARQFPGLPDSALQEIVSHAGNAERQLLAEGRVPLRIAEEARLMQAQVRLDRALLGLYRADLANADSQTLGRALQVKHPQATEAQLLEFALADRQQCAGLIGQQPIKPGFRSPMRLATGRFGYPLSGRGTPRLSSGVAERRLASLYPRLNSEQIATLRSELTASGDLGSAVSALESERHTLERELHRWVWNSRDLNLQFERQRCAEALKHAARREGGTLVLERMRLAQLPVIAAQFPHIRELRIDGLELLRLERDFLSCFAHLEVLHVIGNPLMDSASLFDALGSAPRLRELNLTGNGLTALSPVAQQAVQAMPNLRVLNLRRNSLQLDDTTLSLLTRLRLDVLRLGSNRITLDESLAARFQDMIHPQVLDLDFNPLQRAPDLSFMARLSHLNLNQCELRDWPPGLTTLMAQPQYRLRRLDLSSNHIHAVPNLPTVLRTPFVRDIDARLVDRHWLFNYNVLEAETRRDLLACGINVFEHLPEIPEWQTLWRANASNRQEQYWTQLFDQGENSELLGVLERLTQSAQARRDARGLGARVWALLEKAGQNTALRERLNEVAQAFPPTCGDAGADAFSALEIELLVHQAVGDAYGRAKELLSFYRKVYRRDSVNALADRISVKRTSRKRALQAHLMDEDLPAYDDLDEPAAFPDEELEVDLVDDIEVRLALRQSLAARLDFPEPSDQMLYRDTARITPAIIDKVEVAVRALDADATGRQQWMIEQPAWVQYLKQHYAEQFTLVTDFWRAGHDYLFYCLYASSDPVTRLDTSVVHALARVMPENPLDEDGALRRVALNDGQFDQAMRALTAEQQAVENGLLASLTRQVEVIGS
ncbi:putative E3 ubiquitin-protein ligase ipaH4.5 [compost metagenome]